MPDDLRRSLLTELRQLLGPVHASGWTTPCLQQRRDAALDEIQHRERSGPTSAEVVVSTEAKEDEAAEDDDSEEALSFLNLNGLYLPPWHHGVTFDPRDNITIEYPGRILQPSASQLLVVDSVLGFLCRNRSQRKKELRVLSLCNANCQSTFLLDVFDSLKKFNLEFAEFDLSGSDLTEFSVGGDHGAQLTPHGFYFVLQQENTGTARYLTDFFGEERLFSPSKLQLLAVTHALDVLHDDIDEQLFTKNHYPFLKHLYIYLSEEWPSPARFVQLIEQYGLAKRQLTIHLYSPKGQGALPDHQSIFQYGCPWMDTPVALHYLLESDEQWQPPETFGRVSAWLKSPFNGGRRVRWSYEPPRSETLPPLYTPTSLWQMDAVWKALDTKGQNCRIAVLDSGYGHTHKLFQGNGRVHKHFSCVPNSHVVFDATGHGTAVAGIIAQLAPDAELIIGQVLSADGCRAEWLANGIKEAVKCAADVICISLGVMQDDPLLFEEVHDALTRGVIVVCAASNVGRNARDTISFPAAYGSPICVGAHDERGHPGNFSPSGREIDFLAPGFNVRTAAPPNRWRWFHGTSAAAPFVAALAALLVSCDRHRQPDARRIRNVSHVRSLIRSMCTRPGSHSHDSGYGVIKPMSLLIYGVSHLFETLSMQGSS